MPRDGSGIYHRPAGTDGVPDTPIESTKYNAYVADVEQDLNLPRPIVAGGTGATNTTDAMTALGGELANQVITNYASDPIVPGSFYSAGSATGSPVTGHAFLGFAYGQTGGGLIIEARDVTDTNNPHIKYTRSYSVAGGWSTWMVDGRTIIGSNEGIGGATADMFFGVTGTAPNSSFIVNSKADASGTNLMTVSRATGAIRGNGACPPGALMDFAMPTAPAGWLACDGGTQLIATYPELFAAIGTTWGGDGTTTFGIPALQSRFRRHRDNATLSGTVGTLKSPANLSHTHGVNGDTQFVSSDHSHHIDFQSQGCGSTLDHTHGVSSLQGGNILTAGNGGTFLGGLAGGAGIYMSVCGTSGADRNLDHTHRILGDTGGISANHSHHISLNTGGGTADDANEARPYSAAVLTCIKV